ncbi:conserved hypothetical protein [Neospora caninum Liverpool]|uniref:Uncharacterized protein n=1 Tax=Neospora caninum (strain Liverpool) TaxID=572307 RepID=F0VCK5_NEOCL|nr:conserved hypothetical protein [Neospora caninum Liverpool]CBZ51694.1 conserved hypothetical protein [Neospora caninum Liverpool]|eukprot:XP_003881727.1 conserved hypothetical protein [Neospora caninum Liverpool]
MTRNIYSNEERLQILRDTDHLSVKDAARMAGVTTFTIRHWRRNRAKFLSGPPDERRRVEVVPLSQFETALIQALEGRAGRRGKYSRQELNRYESVRSLSKRFKLRKGVISRSWIDRFIKRRRLTLREKLLRSRGAARIPKEAQSTKRHVARSSAKKSARRNHLPPTSTMARMASRKRMPLDRKELGRGPSEPEPTADAPRSQSLSDILLGIADAAYLLSSPLPTHEELFNLQREFIREQRNKTLDEHLLSPNDIVRDSDCSDTSTSYAPRPWPFISLVPDTWTQSSSTSFCPWRFQTHE